MKTEFPKLPFVILYSIAGGIFLHGIHYNNAVEYFMGFLLLYVAVTLTGLTWSLVQDNNWLRTHARR